MEATNLTASEKALVNKAGLRDYEFDRKICHSKQYLHAINHSGELAIIDIADETVVARVRRDQL